MISFASTQILADRRFMNNHFPASIILIGIIVLAVCSCTSTNTGIQYSKENIFRSDDYIVYRLPGNHTPAELSKKFLGSSKKAWMIEESNPDVSFSSGNAVVIEGVRQ